MLESLISFLMPENPWMPQLTHKRANGAQSVSSVEPKALIAHIRGTCSWSYQLISESQKGYQAAQLAFMLSNR